MKLPLGWILFFLTALALAHPNVGRSSSFHSNLRRNSSAPYQVKEPPLTTPWTYHVGTKPWPEYPRPQLQRPQWLTLNGIWTYENASSLDAVHSPPTNRTLANQVLVPSCLESGLSGIQGNTTIYSWFSTHFTLPKDWDVKSQSILLHFGAVDYEATIFVNGQKAGFNRGGYFEFTIDLTHFLTPGHSNELYVVTRILLGTLQRIDMSF